MFRGGVKLGSILIDTNVYVAFKRNHQSVLALLRQASAIFLNTVVLGELLAGFRGGTSDAENRHELDLFLDTPRASMLQIDDGTAEYFSLVFNQLKKQGTPIPTNDIWIAASAMQHGVALLSLDSHFSNIAGLNIVSGIQEAHA
jgi:predicted nucleic acid-binding protein